MFISAMKEPRDPLSAALAAAAASVPEGSGKSAQLMAKRFVVVSGKWIFREE
jgi:hypothetical protein